MSGTLNSPPLTWLGVLLYSQLPAVPSGSLAWAWCANARVGSQAAGAGTGAFVMGSGGSWYMLGGGAILI